MEDSYCPGQRWMSEAQPDLGLGLITEVEGRRVTVEFPASGETRTYAIANSPLTRVQFAVGDRVEDQQGEPLTVIDLQQSANGVTLYLCENTRGGEVTLPERELNDRLRLNRPQDKLLSRRIDRDAWFTLRYQTWLRQAALWRSPVHGLIGPRVDLIPHQLYIASEVAARQSPRVLLADEVGLGKTIEAGLIMHRLLLSERMRRVLIVVPDTLVFQWLVEMLRRFNLRFSVFSDARFENNEGGNPFLDEQRVLCSLDFLTASPEAARAALAGEWDLLVVDEAHHLYWSEEDSSLEYELIEALAQQTNGVLLLTATPEQLGRSGHFARLRLLDPQRFHDYHAFVAEEDAYQPVAELAARLLDGEQLTESDRQLLAKLGETSATGDPATLIDELVDRHGTGRVLFRNTRQAIKGFPGRQLVSHPLPMPDAYAGLVAEITPEAAYGDGWPEIDPRVAWLAGLLTELAPAKVLVICAHAQTVLDLRAHLLEKRAVHVAVFHEGMEIVERDKAAVFFADQEEGAQALICSEIGSEGRNFQFAHHLVMFDLPLQPELLEQRIGRLDRIGQRETIRIHVPYLRETAGEVLHDWYNDGLNAFGATCPAANAVFGEFTRQLLHAMAGNGGVDALIDAAASATTRINTELENGRDRLLELHSHHPEAADELIRTIHALTDEPGLQDYMMRFWDAYGVEHEPGPGQSTVLRPGNHMLHERFPSLPFDGATVTFDRQDALTHEDRRFLTWEHPMVRGCMELLNSGELGAAAVTVAVHPGFKTGSLFVEMLFVTECAAPVVLEADRYLPPTCIRLLLDPLGKDHADLLAHDELQGLCLTRNRKLAETVIKSQSDKIKLLLQLGEEMATTASRAIVDDALHGMQDVLADELSRLQALAKVNPNIHPEELEQLEAKRELLAIHLKDTRVRLDAVRVIVMR